MAVNGVIFTMLILSHVHSMFYLYLDVVTPEYPSFIAMTIIWCIVGSYTVVVFAMQRSVEHMDRVDIFLIRQAIYFCVSCVCYSCFFLVKNMYTRPEAYICVVYSVFVLHKSRNKILEVWFTNN